MSRDEIDELKQFILQQTTGLQEDTTSLKQDMTNLKQNMAGIRQDVTDLKRNVQCLEQKLERKIDDLSIAVAQALDTVNTTTDLQLKAHDQRIARLERHARIIT